MTSPARSAATSSVSTPTLATVVTKIDQRQAEDLHERVFHPVTDAARGDVDAERGREDAVEGQCRQQDVQPGGVQRFDVDVGRDGEEIADDGDLTTRGRICSCATPRASCGPRWTPTTPPFGSGPSTSTRGTGTRAHP